MWKNYNRMYTEKLSLESGLFFLSKNIHEIPKLKKISLSCISKRSPTVKNPLIYLCGLQLITENKGLILFSKKAIPNLKIRTGQPIGGKVVLRKTRGVQFVNFLVFNVLPYLDLTKLVVCKEDPYVFHFILYSITRLYRILPYLFHFQELNKLELVFTFEKIHRKRNYFLRLLKLPVKSS